MKFEWEEIENGVNEYTLRAKVFGGWVVRFEQVEDCEEEPEATPPSIAVTLVFVPDHNHEWTID